MNRIAVKCLLTAVVILGGIVWFQHRNTVRLRAERDRYRQNSEALLSDMERIRIDSTRMAVDVKTLRLSVSEFERYRAEDARLIKKMGIRIRNLEAAAKHRLSVEAQITAPLRDSIIVRDTIIEPVRTVEMVNPHIEFHGVIHDSVLRAKVHIPVTLHQAVWIEYKRRWIFWKRVKAVHQTIVSDNPYVEIRYSEYIRIE